MIVGLRKVILAALVAACEATASPIATSVPPGTAAPLATVAPVTARPSPSPSPSTSAIPAKVLTGSGAELAPGRYTRQGFEPRITFELDGPWRSVSSYHGFFDVQQDVGTPDVIAVQFGLPDEIAAGPQQAAEITSAEAAASILKSNSRLVTVESSASQIGGLTGYQITVENPADEADFTPVMRVTPGVLQIGPGRRLWCAFFDTPRGVLAILVGGSVAKWNDALAAAEPVLESVTIGQ